MSPASISPQTWTARGYAENAHFVPELGAEVFGWLDPRPGERILDLGCGDGALTTKLAQAGAEVVGVDTSAPLLERAKSRGLDARFMDGQSLTFQNEFDAVFSNAALHWMLRPREVVDGVARALRPGGRFVAEFGGHGNIAAIVTALRALAKARGLDPQLAGGWFYPTAAEYRALLEERGFAVDRIGLFPRPTPLPTGLQGWLLTFRKPYFDAMTALERTTALAELEELLAPALRDQAGNWTADYVRLRVASRIPAG